MPAGKQVTAIAVLLLGLMGALALSALRTKSPTSDEFYHHIANGATYVATGDFRMNPASPPIPRMMAGIAVLARGAKLPLDHSSWETGDSPEFARQFFNVANRGRVDELVFWARVPMVLLSLLFGWMVFVCSRRLWGDIAALVSLGCYVFCPDILAHSGLATADLPVAFFFYLTLFSFGSYLKKPHVLRAVRTGAFMGLAFLCKFTALLLPPILLIWLLASAKPLQHVKATIVALITCWLVIWAGYFFEVKPMLLHTPDPAKKEAFLEKLGGEKWVTFARETPIPTATFVTSVGSLLFTRAKGTHAYLMGQWSDSGWWYYYFVAFVFKNTLPFVLMSLTALFLSRKFLPDRQVAIFLLLPIALFFLVTLPDKAQAGIRYFLPIYPLLFILVGGLAAHLFKKKWGMILVAVLMLWHAGEAVAAYPHYISYFSQAVGGSQNGYKYLRDSNLDWGQDFKGLCLLAKKKNWEQVVLYFYGPSHPEWYGLNYRVLSDEEMREPRKEIYAIGAHNRDSVLWIQGRKPDHTVGHTVFIYDMRRKAYRI